MSLQTNRHYARFSLAVDQLHLVATHLPMELHFENGLLTAQKMQLHEKIWRIFSDLIQLAAYHLTNSQIPNPLLTTNTPHLIQIVSVIHASSAIINAEWKNIIPLLNDENADEILAKIDSLWTFENWSNAVTGRLHKNEYAVFNTNAGWSDPLLRWLDHKVTFSFPDYHTTMLDVMVRSVVNMAHIYLPPAAKKPLLEPWINSPRCLGQLAHLEDGFSVGGKIGYAGGYPLILDKIMDRGPKERLTSLLETAIHTQEKGHLIPDLSSVKSALYRQIERQQTLIASDPEFASLVTKFKATFGSISGY